MAKKFKDFTAKVKDEDGDERESTVRARISDGDETVNAIGGPRAVNKGDIVVERPDSPGTYDVLTAEQWGSTGYSGGDADKPKDPPTSTPNPQQKDNTVTGGTQTSNPTANAGGNK